MKPLSIISISYLLSGGAHLALLGLFLYAIVEPLHTHRSFQTAVYFETTSAKQQPLQSVERANTVASDLENIPLTRKHGQQFPQKKLKPAAPLAGPPELPSLNKYITPPKTKLLEQNNRDGYLRPNKRTKSSTLPLLAEVPKLDGASHPDSGASNHLGSSIKPGSAPKPDTEQPYVPSPSISGKPEKAKTSGAASPTSLWRQKSDIAVYRNTLAKLVTANWIVPQTSVKQFQILIEAQIDFRGNLLSVKLLEGSGLAVLDAAAERAIRVSTPFPKFPDSFGGDQHIYSAVFRFTPDQVAN